MSFKDTLTELSKILYDSLLQNLKVDCFTWIYFFIFISLLSIELTAVTASV